MRGFERPCLVLICLSALVSACGSQVIPRAAVEGSTVTVLIPSSFRVGFGRVEVGSWPPYDPTSELEDPQRGQLHVSLFATEELCGGSTSVPRIKFVAAVNVSSNSSAALDSDSAGLYASVQPQHIAFIEIPQDVVPEGEPYVDCQLKLALLRRKDRSSNEWEALGVEPGQVNRIHNGGTEQPWHGWADQDSDPAVGVPGSPDGIAVRIYPSEGPDLFTDFFVWDRFGDALASASAAAYVEDLEPYPSFQLLVPANGETPRPAAWETEVRFPSGRVTIKGVTALTGDPSSAIVSWDVIGDTDTECTDQDAALRIRFLDPSMAAFGAAISYTLDDFLGCGRATHADFSADTLDAYDADGRPITVTREISTASFY